MGKRRNAGFTLIELMIVVVIIGVLASVAIPQFRKYQLKSKTTEAIRILGALKTNEEVFFSKYGKFGGAAKSPSTWNAANGHIKNNWTISGAGTGFDLLGFRPSGNVYYSYSVKAWADPTMIGAGCAETHGTVDVTVALIGASVDVSLGGIDKGLGNINGVKILAIGNLDAPDLNIGCFISGDLNWGIAGVPAASGESVF